MSIDRLNLVFTIISIGVTLLSIVCSIWAFVSAKKAKRYKSEGLRIVEAFGLEGLLSKFQIESRYFRDKTRNKDWYKGTDVNLIISPFQDVLSSFGKLYHLVKDSENLKGKVHELNRIVHSYEKATAAQRKRANDLILEVMEVLEDTIHNNTQKVIKR